MRIRDLADEVISPAEAFVNAVYAQAAHGTVLPFSLSYYPVASMNPFQRLLYSRAAARGFAAIPAPSRQGQLAGAFDHPPALAGVGASWSGNVFGRASARRPSETS